MSTIKLTYFDMNGGRGEAIRIVMAMGKIEFEDHRISFQQFAQMRGDTPLSAVPVVEIDGVTYTQSNAILRYFGRLVGLYPDNPLEAFKCDEIMGASEDASHQIVKTFGLEGDELKEARNKLCEGALNRYLTLANTRLQSAGGDYFADQRLTIADLKVFVQVRAFVAGVLDHVPTQMVASTAPLVYEHLNRVAHHPDIVAYYEKINA